MRGGLRLPGPWTLGPGLAGGCFVLVGGVVLERARLGAAGPLDLRSWPSGRRRRWNRDVRASPAEAVRSPGRWGWAGAARGALGPTLYLQCTCSRLCDGFGHTAGMGRWWWVTPAGCARRSCPAHSDLSGTCTLTCVWHPSRTLLGTAPWSGTLRGASAHRVWPPVHEGLADCPLLLPCRPPPLRPWTSGPGQWQAAAAGPRAWPALRRGNLRPTPHGALRAGLLAGSLGELPEGPGSKRHLRGGGKRALRVAAAVARHEVLPHGRHAYRSLAKRLGRPVLAGRGPGHRRGGGGPPLCGASTCWLFLRKGCTSWRRLTSTRRLAPRKLHDGSAFSWP